MGAAASVNSLSPEELSQGVASLGKAYKSYTQIVVDEGISGEVLFASVHDDEQTFRAFVAETLGVNKPHHQTAMFQRYIKLLGAGEDVDSISPLDHAAVDDVWEEHGIYESSVSEASEDLWCDRGFDEATELARCALEEHGIDQTSVSVSVASKDATTSIVTLVEMAAINRAQVHVRRESGQVTRPKTATVHLEGAMGPAATGINGYYEATTELSGDMPVYVKVGARCVRLEYCAASKKWHVKTSANKGKDGGWAHCAVPTKCLPQDCPARKWQVFNGTVVVRQPTVTISSVGTQEEVEAYRAHVEREAARIVKGIEHVCITGATGPKADHINGEYKPTEEMCGNATVYVMVDDDDMWLEYRAAKKQWQVKTTAGKGKDGAWASCDVPVKCLPENCPLGKWLVDPGPDTPGFVLQSAVTIASAI